MLSHPGASLDIWGHISTSCFGTDAWSARVRDGSAGLAARFWLDAVTKLPLRREIFGAGTVSQVVTALPGAAAPGFWQRMARGLHRIASWINPLR
jgi:hypothetical protein